MKNALGAAPDQWSRTVGAKFSRDAPSLTCFHGQCCWKQKGSTRQPRPRATSRSYSISIADAGIYPRPKNSGVWSQVWLVRRALEKDALGQGETACPVKTTRQGAGMGSACEKDAYGDELRLGTLFPENVDELDVLIFGGDIGAWLRRKAQIVAQRCPPCRQ